MLVVSCKYDPWYSGAAELLGAKHNKGSIRWRPLNLQGDNIFLSRNNNFANINLLEALGVFHKPHVAAGHADGQAHSEVPSLLHGCQQVWAGVQQTREELRQEMLGLMDQALAKCRADFSLLLGISTCAGGPAGLDLTSLLLAILVGVSR